MPFVSIFYADFSGFEWVILAVLNGLDPGADLVHLVGVLVEAVPQLLQSLLIGEELAEVYVEASPVTLIGAERFERSGAAHAHLEAVLAGEPAVALVEDLDGLAEDRTLIFARLRNGKAHAGRAKGLKCPIVAEGAVDEALQL